MKEKFIRGNHNLTNTYERYAVVDSKNKIIETFRQKLTAVEALKTLQKDYLDEELSIIVIPEKKFKTFK